MQLIKCYKTQEIEIETGLLLPEVNGSEVEHHFIGMFKATPHCFIQQSSISASSEYSLPDQATAASINGCGEHGLILSTPGHFLRLCCTGVTAVRK